LGACVVILQNDLSTRLVPSIQALLGDVSVRQSLAEHLQQTAGGDAAAHIAEMLVHITKK
jgi:UDP-N-acetylglucosamine:LPS N-acetylglucosamine transferase